MFFIVFVLLQLSHFLKSERIGAYHSWENSTFIEKTIHFKDASLREYKSPQKFKSNSQSGQDVFVLTVLSNKTDGYFVDLAANHWSDFSNTNSLEQFHNWTGICIEPNPVYLDGLVYNRLCSVFTNPISSESNEIVKFHMEKGGGGLGGIVREFYDNAGKRHNNVDMITVSLVSLLKHLKAPSKIDYLSLDVEGGEWEALKSFDFNLYEFKLISIERPIKKLQYLLFRHGYRFVYLISNYGDCFFIHISHPEFHSIISRYHAITQFRWDYEEHHGLLYNITADSFQKKNRTVSNTTVFKDHFK